MPYEFASGEPAGAAVLRIAHEQLDRALAHLTTSSDVVAERVHETRKRFKEMRALLRLARYALPEDFAAENAWYRDAARTLAAARDTEAVIEAIDELRDDVREKSERDALKTVKWLLRADVDDGGTDVTRAMETLARSLPLCRARITTWPPIARSFRLLARGFARTYDDGRRAMALAIANSQPELFHEWRKRVKDHWYHVQLLRNLSPEMSGRMAALQQLSRDLGDHHDLVVLEQSTALASCESDVRAIVSRLVSARRAALERRAVAAGSMVYAEEPASFRRRLERAWRQTHGAASRKAERRASKPGVLPAADAAAT